MKPFKKLDVVTLTVQHEHTSRPFFTCNINQLKLLLDKRRKSNLCPRHLTYTLPPDRHIERARFKLYGNKLSLLKVSCICNCFYDAAIAISFYERVDKNQSCNSLIESLNF